ncbi:hypothetical protein HYW20_05655 [Candidatus Woesearchaeota archaeon]|nr:hypothetical protein [Candidatus Woesearchaeota archaeon]
MNKKLAEIVLGVSGGLAALVSDLNHSKQINILHILDETKPVIQRYVGSDNPHKQSYWVEYKAHEISGDQVILYDFKSEDSFLFFLFTTSGSDGRVDFVVRYRKKGDSYETTYHNHGDEVQWQPMLDQILKSKKIKDLSQKSKPSNSG